MKFLENLGRLEEATADAMILLHGTRFFDSDENRMTFRSLLLSSGADLLVSMNDSDIFMAIKVAETITVIECTYYSPDEYIREKCRDLKHGGPRVVVRFFDKRIDCSCLKEMYKFSQKFHAMQGYCCHCGMEREYSTLKVCSRCKFSHYCSQECQFAAWPVHKTKCLDWDTAKKILEVCLELEEKA